MLTLSSNVTLNYEVRNVEAETTLLFFNGATLPLEFWAPLQTQLDGFHCISFDQRNSGLTQFQGTFTLGDTAADAAALLDHLEVKSVTAIGHAWGGRAAQVFARDYPHLVSRLVVCGTGGQLPAKTDPKQLMALNTARKSEDRAAWEDAISITYCGELFRQEQPDAFVDTTDLLWNAPTPRSARWDQEPYPSSSYWGTCVQPTLLVYGSEDKYGTRENADDLHTRANNSRLHFIEGAGHFVVREAPQQVARLITEFISEGS